MVITSRKSNMVCEKDMTKILKLHFFESNSFIYCTLHDSGMYIYPLSILDMLKFKIKLHPLQTGFPLTFGGQDI